MKSLVGVVCLCEAWAVTFGAADVARAVEASTTAGWEDISSGRREVAPVKVLWRADFSRPETFAWELVGGAEGKVEVVRDGVRISKTNGEGYIIVRAKPFAVKKDLEVRFAADEEVSDADVDYSSGFLRGVGKSGSLFLDSRCESAYGGLQEMRGLPCTAPGVRYRKYSQARAADGELTPVIVVSGAPSESSWYDWHAEDAVEAINFLKAKAKLEYPIRDRRPEAEEEARFDARLAADIEHTAKIERRDGFSKFVIDGDVVAPVVFHGCLPHKYWIDKGYCDFAGRRLDGSDVKVAIVSTRCRQFYRDDGSWDVKAIVDALKMQMRLAPKSLYMIGVAVEAPPNFIEKHHPDQAWLDEKGNRVMGVGGYCIVGRNHTTTKQFAENAVAWPSPSSPVWRALINSQIEALVKELRERGLTKRIVGVHLFGYHDGQMTICYTDHSPCAKAEYARMIAEPDCISTNYAYCMRLAGQRALNEFARTFKRALGKPAVAIKWCESPWQLGKRDADTSFTDFTRCDAIDVLVCQPDYRERFPGFPGTSTPPLDSLHLHGKMYWAEFDIRTFADCREDAKQILQSPPYSKRWGRAADMGMWRTMYRKYAGEADATRMGYWLYDIGVGFYDHPELAADIREVVAEEEELARLKPSPWRPDVAMVVDESQMLRGEDPLAKLDSADCWLYAWNCRYFGSSGVPYQRYLAADAFEHPELLKDKKLVVLACFHEFDAKRTEWLARLAAQGTSVVFLSGSGMGGGADAIGFAPYKTKVSIPHRIVAEPGVTDNVSSPIYVNDFRNSGDLNLKQGPHVTLKETPELRVLARYAVDHTPAVAERTDSGWRRLYVCEPGGLTPALLNRFAREAGAYVAIDRPGVQLDMNGDFLSVHCLRPGSYRFRLPFDCRVKNLKSGDFERVENGAVTLNLTAGETCRFRLLTARSLNLSKR